MFGGIVIGAIISQSGLGIVKEPSSPFLSDCSNDPGATQKGRRLENCFSQAVVVIGTISIISRFRAMLCLDCVDSVVWWVSVMFRVRHHVLERCYDVFVD